MNDPNLIDIFAKIFGCYCLFTTVAAVILNQLVLYICLKSKQLRSKSTFKMLALSSINDMISCISWNQEDFTVSVLNYFTAKKNLIYCKWISVFLQFTTIELESWILLSISTDRLLSMLVKNWSKSYFSGYRPYFYIVFLHLVIAGVNFHEVFTVGYSDYDNATDTEVVKCYATHPYYDFDWYGFASQVKFFNKLR